MKKKNIEIKRIFFLLVLAFFLVFFSFSLYTVLSGIISFGELEKWDGETVATEFASGNGSEENPYVIHDAPQFMYFKSLIEGDTYESYQDKYYVLDSNIDFGGHSITPIGIQEEKTEKIFSGVLDGKGYTLSDFKIEEASQFENTSYFALFSKISEGHIFHLNLENYQIHVPDLTDVHEDDFEVVISGLVGDIEKGQLENVSLRDFNIRIKEYDKGTIGVIAGTSSEVSIHRVYVDGEITNSKEEEIHYFEKGEADTIISHVTYKGEINHDLISNYYVFENDHYVIGGEEISTDSLLELLNDELDTNYYWKYEKERFIFYTHDLDVIEVPSSSKSFAFSIQNSNAISLHATGREGQSIYINDLDSDYYYYMGLNYTEITNTNGTIPSGVNQNLYSNSNLATVYIRYSSADINDNTVSGSVSVSENYRDIYYYKRYPVVDGYIEFDLIDNPWANRPNGKAFNGWVTDYTDAVISIDTDVYVRHVRVPVLDVSVPLSITFYSSWTDATTVNAYGDFSNLKSVSMVALDPSVVEDLRNYYYFDHIVRYDNYPNTGNLYTLEGVPITNGASCNRNGGCDFVRPVTINDFDYLTQYYDIIPIPGTPNVEVKSFAPTVLSPIEYYDATGVGAGYFVQSTDATTNIYSNSGVRINNCNGDCYQLVQYSDGPLDPYKTYYYLVTRDTNIYAPGTNTTINTGNLTINKPMTITGINNGVDNSNNRTLYLNNNFTPNADLRIEFIRFYQNTTTTNVTDFNADSYKIIGNFTNLKLGRGLKRNGTNITASSFVGGTNSSTSGSSITKYTTIVESGFYQNGSGVGFRVNNNVGTHRISGLITLGADVDRVLDTTNQNLIVYYSYAGSWGSNLYNVASGTTNTYDFPAIKTIVKSGSYGTNQANYAAGIYVGGRAAGSHYTLREVIVEGGYIFNLIGGPSSATGRSGKNDIIINVKGGEIDNIFGGAGASNTVGNRILNVTGGTINYGVLGGSNAYINPGSGTTDPYGKIDGDTLVYVGGNVVVGTKDDSLYNVDSGNVFGAGNGRRGELDVGAVNNSNVIIGPDATINGDVYGGGNFGAVGGNLTGTSTYSGGSSSTGGDGGLYEDGTADNNIRYYGDNPDNYIRFNNENYRIVGLFHNVDTPNGQKDLVRIVKTTYSSGNTAWANAYIGSTNNRTYPNYFVRNDNGNTKSNIYTNLNNTYYNGLNATYRNYIQTVNWKLGAIGSDNNIASSFYTAERSNTPGSSYNVTSFDYKVGLLYASDYGYASGLACLGTNLSAFSNGCSNWIGNMISSAAWFMTPSTYSETIGNRNYPSYHIFYLNTNDNVNSSAVAYYSYGYSYRTYAVYPSFYLVEDISISGGSGTSSDPYIIGNGDRLADIIDDLAHPVTPDVDPYVPIEDDGVYHAGTDYQALAKIHIVGGTIEGSVFGAGNNNGSGNMTNNRVANTQVLIEMDGGTVGESIYGGSNEQGTVYGDVLLHINNGTVTDSVYGGGKGGGAGGTYVSRNVDVYIGNENTSNLTIGRNVYGGSAFGTVNGIMQGEGANDSHIRVTVNDGVITGSVFGGGEGDSTYTPSEYGNVYVHINGGNMSNVFGGNDSKGEPSGCDIVYLNDGIIGNAFGGGNNTGQTYSDIRLQGSIVSGNIYGGSNASGDVVDTHVTITSGSVSEVFGGNNLGGEAGATYVNVTGGTISTAVYGGGKQAETTTTHVTVSGCSVPDVYGGGKQAGVDATTNVQLTNASATKVFGGSNTSGDVPSSRVQITGSTVGSVYGGNNSGGTTVTTNVILETSTITNVFGGGDNASSTTSNIDVQSGTITNVYGGGNEAGVTTTNVEINGGSVSNVYGGSNRQGNIDKSNVAINGGNTGTVFGGNNLGGLTTESNITSTGGYAHTVYGGGNLANVTEANLTLDSLSADTIYGGGNEAPITGDVNLTITDSTLTGSIFGGGNAAGVNGNVIFDMDSTTVAGNVYGGGNEGIVQHNTNVWITDSTIESNVFAGGNGATAVVYGNSTITIDGDTVVGTSTSVAPNAGCVFGSGNAASTGASGAEGVATVNIVGGEFYGNVYGGPKMAVVYGTTVTNIGTSAVNQSGLVESDILIHGTVFGGGESNASGSETYDYTFISVTDGITVNIDGTDYIENDHDFIINGSIFGSGNASSSAGDSNINIKNLGSRTQPNRAISIQRATNLVIDHSVVELMGTTDRTNEYSDILYSFNLIDKMTIKNDTVLYLKHNANMLKELYSGVDVTVNNTTTLVKAAVQIDDENKTVTKNTDNRIYMTPGQNLNITINQAANAYGRVSGMTFFGMYTSGESNNYRTGLYDSQYSYGDSGNASLEVVGGSYVVGLRNVNHDIEVDGFYTNVLDDEDYSEIVTQFINPSPIGETGYRWIIGFEAINYIVPLTLSKYSSLGTYELSMLDFAQGDTVFTILGFDSSGLESDVEIIDSNLVPRIAATEEEANGTIGLSMKVETQEWTGTGTTKFFSANGGSFTGGREYSTDSRSIAPSVMFYAYHAKNYSRTGDLGEATITMQVAIPKNQIDFDITFVTITVQIQSRNYGDGANYDASITYDKKYEMPAATSVNITNQSQFTTYFSLTEFFDNFQTIYGNQNQNYHVITFTKPLPVNTLITMMDFGANDARPDYYYYRITQADYDAAVLEAADRGEASYRLSKFIKMDSTSTNNTYNDATANLLYYDADTNMVDEEFMFIIDLKETTETGEFLNNKASFELRNADDWGIINVVSARDAIMVYNMYESSNVVLSQTFTDVDSYLYYNVSDDFHYSTAILYNETENRQSVIDTNYEYSSMGLNVVVYDRTGEPVSSSLLLGSSITIANREYFADGDGVFRIKLANKVSNIERDVNLVVGKNLPAGNYTIRYTLFASEDGLHNSTYQNSVYRDFAVTVVSASSYITVDCADTTKLVYGETGKNHAGTTINTYTVHYVADLSHPNYRVEVYKRKTDNADSVVYDSVPFSSLFQNSFTVVSGNEVALPIVEEDEESFDFVLASNLTSGTYRVVFKLYDNNQLIDSDTKNVIVQKKVD